MGKKAVYNKQYLAIYITKEDFDLLLSSGTQALPVYIGKDERRFGWAIVNLSDDAQASLKSALQAERAAVKEIQDQFAKDNPNYESSYKVQRRQQRGRKRLRQRTDDASQV